MNVVAISGRLTKNPELRTTTSLKHVCSFSIAVNRYASDECDFIECVCFNKIAENLCKYKSKGDLIELTGHIQTSKYTDKNNKNVYKTLINVETINYINSTKKSEDEQINAQNDAYLEMSKKVADDDDDLPF